MPRPRSLGEVFGGALSQFSMDYPRFVALKQAETQRQQQFDFDREITLERLGLSQAAGGRAQEGLDISRGRFGLEQQRFGLSQAAGGRAERQLGLGEQAGFRAQSQFEAERDAPPEPLTVDQRRSMFFDRFPEEEERFFRAEVSAAELKGQRKPEKGPGLSARITAGKDIRGSEVRRLSGDIMERFEEIDPSLFDKIVKEGEGLPTEDPAILSSIARRFLETEDKPGWFTGDRFIPDPTITAKLDTLGQVFGAPAIQPELGSPAMETWIKQAYPSRWRSLSLKAKQKLFSKYGPG